MTIVVISPGNTLIKVSTHPKSPPPRAHGEREVYGKVKF